MCALWKKSVNMTLFPDENRTEKQCLEYKITSMEVNSAKWSDGITSVATPQFPIAETAGLTHSGLTSAEASTSSTVTSAVSRNILLLRLPTGM